MTGTGSSTSIGILASQVADVHIQGPGGIIGYNAAIVLEGVDKVEVVNVSCVGNADGLELSFHSTRNRIVNSAFDNGSVGPGILLALSTDNHIDGNEVNGNRGGGISLANGATGNQIHANTAFGSLSGPDMADGNPNCDSNDWDGNHFGTANPSSCIK